MLINIFGILGTVLGILMYSPQVIKVWKTKRVEDLSKSSFTIIVIGMIGWMFYGGMNRDFLPWLVNFVISVMMFVIIWYVYDERKSIPVILLFLIGQITSLLFLVAIRVYPSDLVNSILIVIAGIGTGLGLFFQLFKVLKTKKTDDISVIMLILVVINQIIWTIRWSLMIVDDYQFSYVLTILFSATPIISAVGLLMCKQLIKPSKAY